jgi:hypothetical protein
VENRQKIVGSRLKWGSHVVFLRCFSFPTNKTDSHDITDILLKVALNTIILTLYIYIRLKIKPVLALDLRAVKFLFFPVRLLSNYNIKYMCTIYTRLCTCLTAIPRFALREKVTLRLLKLLFKGSGCGRMESILYKRLEASDNHTIYLSHWISKLLRILG